MTIHGRMRRVTMIRCAVPGKRRWLTSPLVRDFKWAYADAARQGSPGVYRALDIAQECEARFGQLRGWGEDYNGYFARLTRSMVLCHTIGRNHDTDRSVGN